MTICDFCDYAWAPRKANPKACPRCKRRFDYPISNYPKQNSKGVKHENRR